MIISIMSTIGALGKRLGIVKKNLQMWLGFTKADVLGAELVDDGDFLLTGTQAASTTGTYWKTASGWTISGGVATYDAVAETYLDNLNSINIGIGDIIKVTFTLNSDAKLRFVNELGSRFSGTWVVYQAGTYTEYLTSGITAISLGIQGDTNNGSFGVSNISVNEVAQFITDKSTNSNNAKLFTGKALSFNGNDKVVIGDVGVVKTLVFTFSPLANITSSTSGKRLIGFNTTFLGISTGAITGDLTGETLTILTGTNGRTAITNSFDGGSFYRVILSWNPSLSQFDVYINGQKQTTINSGTSVLANFTNLILGTTVTEQSYYSGILSDVQVYNTSWTSDDAVYDYANPNNLVFNNSASSISVSNLKGYYALSEGSGSIAYDSATPLGSDEVVNGDFEIASGAAGGFWTAGSGWSISGNGLATRAATGTNYAVDRDSFLTINQIYKVIIEISVVTSGNVTVVLGATNSPSFTSSGTYTFIGVQTSNTKLRISPSSDYVGSVSNISVKEVSAGTITGATYDDKQPTIPQLGMMDWAKSTPDGTNEVTLIEAPNDIGKDVLGNSLRLRDGGFNLDGSGYGSIANDTTLQFGTTAFTIQAWIKPSSLTANNRVITKGVTGNGEWMLSIGTNCIRVYAKDSSGNALDTSSTFSVLTLDVWQMITVVIDTPNNQILFYLNDGSVETKTGGAWTGSFNNTLPITIGNTSSVSSGQFFDGIVDESLIYNSELSAKEIKNNYKIGLSKHS